MLQNIALSKILPHPDNPRLFSREGVVNAIAEQIKVKGCFEPRHAPHVRRTATDEFQLISGHQRCEAAKRAGLKEIPCVVVEMDDEEALCELLLSNAQSDLEDLEVGLFLLKAVPKGKAGRGNKNGLAEYARQMGASRESYQKYRSAAEVALKSGTHVPDLIEHTRSLAAIHGTPESDWPELVKRMLKGWTVEQTEGYVETIKSWEIPDELIDVFPRSALLERFFQTREFSATAFAAVVSLIRATEQILRSFTGPEGKAAADTFRVWMREHPNEALDQRAIFTQQRALLQTLEHAQLEAERSWNLGDWRGYIADLPDGSVALVLTDPPYGLGYQGTRSKVRQHREIVNDDNPEMAMRELTEVLKALYPKLKQAAHILVFCHWSLELETRAAVRAAGFDIPGSLIWVKDNHGVGDLACAFAPKHERVVHGIKGRPMLCRREPDVFEVARPTNGFHPTEKPVLLLEKLIEATTVPGELVVDPFGGVGSTLIASKRLARKGWSCEIDEEYYREGSRRIAAENAQYAATPQAATVESLVP